MMFDKEYMFKGKHAQMVSELQAKLSDQIPRGFFGSNYEVYKIAPIIGYIYQRKSKPDVTSSETKKIDVNSLYLRIQAIYFLKTRNNFKKFTIFNFH